MIITASKRPRGVLGIAGHAGAGHVHSHSGFVQDDSAGFAVAACLLRRAFPVNTAISSVKGDPATSSITVRTEGGGTGIASARRGITPFEATLARQAIGMDAIYSQSAALRAFGRIYGQGCLELPVALQAATCLAAIDTFEKKHPGLLLSCPEAMEGKVGRCLGAVIEIDSVPVSVLAVLNASEGGIGPDEDLEGNVMLGEKGRLMKILGLDALPTIILESKAYVPGICRDLDEDTFWIRMNGEVDNRFVYESLIKGALAARLPYLASDTAYPRGCGDMATATQALGKKIAKLGNELATAESAREKVRIVAELALLVSQDAGGISFMSSKLHDAVGGGGIMPGSSAVLSLAVSESSIRTWKIPVFTARDSDLYLEVLEQAVPALQSCVRGACDELEKKRNFAEGDFDYLLCDR
jgi:hypothetical protein